MVDMSGRPVERVDISGLTKAEHHARAHIVNPDLHPDYDPGPSIDKLREIARRKQRNRARHSDSSEAET